MGGLPQAQIRHDHPSYAHVILQMSLTHWVKFEPYSYGQMLHQGEVPSLRAKPINCSECSQTI
jgi:hypothetical protein